MFDFIHLLLSIFSLVIWLSLVVLFVSATLLLLRYVIRTFSRDLSERKKREQENNNCSK